MAEKITEILNVSAVRDKRNPPCLTINGEVLLYSSNGTAKFKVSDPQGYVESILLLDLEVTEGDGPKKGVFKPIETFEWCDFKTQKFQQVQIRYQGADQTIDILG